VSLLTKLPSRLVPSHVSSYYTPRWGRYVGEYIKNHILLGSMYLLANDVQLCVEYIS